MKPSTRAKIIQKVGKLLEDGKRRAANETDEVWHEYYRIFPAQDYLIKECYERRQDAELQRMFGELVPDNAILQSKKKSDLKDLRSKSMETRKSAAISICKSVYNVQGSRKSLWLRHPFTSSALISALRRETDPRIQEEILATVAVYYERNFRDPRLFDAVVPYFESDDRKVLEWTVRATASMKRKEKWKYVLPLLRECKTNSMMLSLCGHLDTAYKRNRVELLEIVYDYFMLPKSKNPDVLMGLAYGINDLLDEDNLSWFRDFADLENEKLKPALKTVIERAKFHDPHPLAEKLF